LILVSFVNNSCQNNNQTGNPPPSATFASVSSKAQSGANSSPCRCNAGVLGRLVFNGQGSLKVNVTSNNATNFVPNYVFIPIRFSNPTIIGQNGTTPTIFNNNQLGSNLNSDDIVSVSVPWTNSYKIKIIYIQYG